MATIVRGPSDPIVERLRDALDHYEREHPGAEASLYRQNPGSIRIRIFDERFAGMSRSRRHDEAWKFLEARAGSEPMAEVSMLLLLPRSEQRASLSNLEFDDPVTSSL